MALNETFYDIRYSYGSATHSKIVTAGTVLELANLEPNTTVSFAVRTRCSGVPGPWTIAVQSTSELSIKIADLERVKLCM